jgi:outer membrane immunogenic protein
MGNMMKKFLLTTAAVVLAAPVFAADMARPVMKAPVAPVPFYNWSGFYVGVDGGWAGSRQDVNWPFSTGTTAFSHDRDSGFLSAHVGVQWQFGNFVLGVEGSGVFLSSHLETGSPPTGCPNTLFTCQASVDQLWTVGPRAGVVLGNNWLVYGTGGFASGRVRTRSFLTSSGAIFDDLSHRDDGWFIGGGVEYMVANWGNHAWIFGAEYRHVDLGTHRFLSVSGVPDTNTRDVDTTVDLVAARLSLKWNWARY